MQDHTVDIATQLAGIPQEVKVDIDQYIFSIHSYHKTPRIYKASEGAMAKFVEFKQRLNEFDAQSDYG